LAEGDALAEELVDLASARVDEADVAVVARRGY
jgi:hypothetical protein